MRKHESIDEIVNSVLEESSKEIESFIEDEFEKVTREGEKLSVSRNVQKEVESIVEDHETHEALAKGYISQTSRSNNTTTNRSSRG